MAKKLIAGLMLTMFLFAGISANAETAKDVTKAGSTVLTVSIDGIGAVKSTPAGIKCMKGNQGTCSYKFATGTHVTLTPAAYSGSQFKSWTGCIPKTTGISKRDGVACVLKMDAAKKVVAAFGILSPGAGVEGGACLAESKCNGALICKNSICSKCSADADCVSGKICSTNGACEVKPCPDGMVLIKGGTFQMGSDKYNNLNPIHDVTVSDLCMDENEFTNKKKDELKVAFPTLGAIDGGGKFIGWDDLVTTYTSSDFYSNDHPLVGVSWYVAKRICELQNKRLPTEAEWEYAARGGTQAEYGIKDGAAPTKDNACWSCENNACVKSTTCNVKSYPPPNAFGLYDMSGNVWEWVEDYYNAYPGAEESDYWKSISKDTYRVVRGGSWAVTYPNGLRADFRLNNDPGDRYIDLGFRCAVLPEDFKE